MIDDIVIRWFFFDCGGMLLFVLLYGYGVDEYDLFGFVLYLFFGIVVVFVVVFFVLLWFMFGCFWYVIDGFDGCSFEVVMIVVEVFFCWFDVVVGDFFLVVLFGFL